MLEAPAELGLALPVQGPARARLDAGVAVDAGILLYRGVRREVEIGKHRGEDHPAAELGVKHQVVAAEAPQPRRHRRVAQAHLAHAPLGLQAHHHGVGGGHGHRLGAPPRQVPGELVVAAAGKLHHVEATVHGHLGARALASGELAVGEHHQGPDPGEDGLEGRGEGATVVGRRREAHGVGTQVQGELADFFLHGTPPLSGSRGRGIVADRFEKIRPQYQLPTGRVLPEARQAPRNQRSPSLLTPGGARILTLLSALSNYTQRHECLRRPAL